MGKKRLATGEQYVSASMAPQRYEDTSKSAVSSAEASCGPATKQKKKPATVEYSDMERPHRLKRNSPTTPAMIAVNHKIVTGKLNQRFRMNHESGT